MKNLFQKRGIVIHRFRGEVIRKEVTDLLENKDIFPSDSPYNSPVWVVPKKADPQGNKRWRMVIDYRALNEKTIHFYEELFILAHIF